jgi:hypothetical protein
LSNFPFFGGENGRVYVFPSRGYKETFFPFAPLLKYSKPTGCWWFIPIKLATQEVELRRIAVQTQPRQIAHEILC